MKKVCTLSILAIAIAFIATACNKGGAVFVPDPDRGIGIILKLLTEKDPVDNNSKINFSIFIRSRDRILLDSAMSIMKISDIPGGGNKLTFEKYIPIDHEELAAGFRYTIENGKRPFYVDTIKPGAAIDTIVLSSR